MYKRSSQTASKTLSANSGAGMPVASRLANSASTCASTGPGFGRPPRDRVVAQEVDLAEGLNRLRRQRFNLFGFRNVRTNPDDLCAMRQWKSITFTC